MTTDDTGKPVFWVVQYRFVEESQRTEEFGIFVVKSVTADGSLLSPTGGCKGNKPCTSYSRTNGYGKLRTNGYGIAYTFTHNNITLEHTAMNDKNTIAHTARRPLMHIGFTSHLWLKFASCVSSHPCMRTCVLRLGCFLLACLFLLPLPVPLPALPDVQLSAR